MPDSRRDTLRYAEDMRLGEELRLGPYAVAEADMIEYAAQWDPQFFHTDPERASAEGHFGGLIASGMHTLSIYQRLSILARPDRLEVIGGRGISELAFRRPVRPGDVLSGSSTLIEINLEPERERGLITHFGELRNQRDEQVLSLKLSAYLAMRPA